MNLYANANKYPWRYILAATMSVGCTSAIAMSRVGTAEVSTVDGLPCFSIPQNAETKNGLPLRGIVVSEIQTRDRSTVPTELWHFVAADPSTRIWLHPQTCIRYGEAPIHSVQRSFKPLEPYKVYYVNLNARKDDSGMIGYVAKFCVKAGSDGKIMVQAISPDERGGDKRYGVCANAR
jgi:hypothetical protein